MIKFDEMQDLVVIEECNLMEHSRVEILLHGTKGHPIVKIATQCYTRPYQAEELAKIIAAVLREPNGQWEIEPADGDRVVILRTLDAERWCAINGCSRIVSYPYEEIRDKGFPCRENWRYGDSDFGGGFFL